MGKKQWRQCGRKKRYRDEHTANHFRKMFEQERGKKLDYYWCRYCNGFHLTSRESLLSSSYVVLEQAVV